MSDSGEVVAHTIDSAQLADQLLGAIRRGVYPPDRPLPSYRELCAEYDVGMRTVRRAMSVLAQEGIVRIEDRRGVFVDSQPSEHDCFNVIVPNIQNPDHAVLVTALSLAGRARGLDMRLSVVEEGRKEPDAQIFEHEYIESLRRENVAGVIKAPTAVGPEGELFRQRLREKGIPLVMVNDFYSERMCDNHVLINERVALDRILRHLVDFGHRHLIYLEPGSDQHVFIDRVLASTVENLTRGEGTLTFLPRCWAEFSDADWRRWEAALEQCTAIIATSYPYARQAKTLVGHLGLRVPRDVSIVTTGCGPTDDVDMTEMTCCAVDYAEVAEAAMDLLLKCRRKGRNQQILFEPELRSGMSSGPARMAKPLHLAEHARTER